MNLCKPCKKSFQTMHKNDLMVNKDLNAEVYSLEKNCSILPFNDPSHVKLRQTEREGRILPDISPANYQNQWGGKISKIAESGAALKGVNMPEPGSFNEALLAAAVYATR